MGAKPPLELVKSMVFRGFQAPTGAEPPPWKEKNACPTLEKFLTTPLCLLSGVVRVSCLTSHGIGSHVLCLVYSVRRLWCPVSNIIYLVWYIILSSCVLYTMCL